MKKVVFSVVVGLLIMGICFAANASFSDLDQSHWAYDTIAKMFDKGLNVCINTDDRTVSNIYLNEEYRLLKQYFNFTDDDFRKMNINAMKHSFADKKTKDEIIRLLK